MIFKQFCEREMIDPTPFMGFILKTYISGWMILNNRYALEMAWKDFLGKTYLDMLINLEMKK